MALHRYPDAAKHKGAHAEFVKALQAAKADYDAHGATASLSIAVNRFVCSWLREHIGSADTALGKFLVAAGVQAVAR